MFFKFQTLFINYITEMSDAGTVGQALGAQPGIFNTDAADTKTTMALFGSGSVKKKKKKKRFPIIRRPLHKKDL